jgi:hypothetical protein
MRQSTLGSGSGGTERLAGEGMSKQTTELMLFYG